MVDVVVSWNDINYGEDGYRVYRDTSPMSPGSFPAPIADLGPGSNQYTDAGLTPNITYYYRVSSYFPDTSEYVSEEFSITPSSIIYLLDSVTLPQAAYSVRKLRSAYAGAAIRVRRSSDSTEQDIGFSGEDLDTTALASFCGAGDGYVTKWYDQTGNANHVTFATQASQPVVYESGAVKLENGKPAIWTRANGYIGFDTGVGSGWTTKTLYALVNPNRFDGLNSNPARVLSGYLGSGSVGDNFLLDRTATDDTRLFDGAKTINLGTGAGGRTLFFCYRNASQIGVSINGGSMATASSPNAIGNGYNIHLFEDASGTSNDEQPTNYQEVVLYSSDETADAASMKTNMNNYYTIY